MSYLMGIDIGTTGTKTLLMDEKGKLIATALEEYPLYHPQPNWVEQNSEDWWEATINSIKKVLKQSSIKSKEIKGIGLSGQMHGLVPLGKKYKVLRPSILWCDQRTVSQCNYITAKIGEKKLIELTCNPALTGFTAPKILWLKENEPHIYAKTFKILLPKDYIRFKLTGTFASEVSDASGTLLFDVKNRCWSKEMLDKLEISEELLPQVYESSVISGNINKYAANLTGLTAGTPIVGGGGDQAAGAVGNGIVELGIVSSTLGTSGVIFAFSDKVQIDSAGRVHTFCHAVPHKWHIMGVMLSAGSSLKWLRDTLSPATSYEMLTKKATEIPPGSEGLIFLPYLMGERTPHKDPFARGVFFGLTPRHRKAHLIRAVMEGVAYGMKDSLEIIKGMKVRINQVRASGGGAKSSLWRQMQADINNIEIVTLNVEEGPAFGAALLAGVGTKIYKNVKEATKETIEITRCIKPIKENVQRYEKYYKIYRSLYPSLKNNFKEISTIVNLSAFLFCVQVLLLL